MAAEPQRATGGNSNRLRLIVIGVIGVLVVAGILLTGGGDSDDGEQAGQPVRAPGGASSAGAPPVPVASGPPALLRLEPGELTLSVGDTATVTVAATEWESEVSGFQLLLQFDTAKLKVEEPACTGLFEGGAPLPAIPQEGGVMLGCYVPSGTVKGAPGEIFRFSVSRVVAGPAQIALSSEGPLGTQFAESGVTIPAQGTNTVHVGE